MMTVAEYRQKAAEARALATISPRQEMRDDFEALAVEWEVLAAKSNAMDVFCAKLIDPDVTE